MGDVAPHQIGDEKNEESAPQGEVGLGQIADTIEDVLWITRWSDQQVIFASAAYTRIWGRSIQGLYDNPYDWTEAIHPNDRRRALEHFKRLDQGHTYDEEYRIVRPDGSARWIRDRGFPIRDDRGNVSHVAGIAQDITQRKREESFSSGQNRVLELLARGADLQHVLTELALTIEQQAPGMVCSILLLDRGPWTLHHGAAPTLPGAYNRAVDGIRIGPNVGSCGSAAYRCERVVVDNIGTDPLWADYRELALKHDLQACWSQPVVSSTGDVLGTFAMYYRTPRSPVPEEIELIEKAANLAGIAIERKQAETSLRESEQQFQKLFYNAPDLFAAIDPDTTVIKRCNEAFLKKTGYDEREVIGQPVSTIYDPQISSLALQAFERFVTTGVVRDAELRLRRKNGTTFEVSLNVSSVRDERGHILYGLACWRDISERKRLEKQLRLSQKMEALGRLAGGVAHDFNNLLTVILGNADMAMADLEQQTTNLTAMKSAFDEIRGASHRAASLTRQLLTFSRKQMLEPKVVDLNQIVVAMQSLLMRLIGENINLCINLDSEISTVFADQSQIEQVIMNLVLNARDAMPQGGRVVVATAEVDLDESYTTPEIEACGGRFVMFEVSDSGAGMDSEALDQAFDPFFTTKPPGQGTGLGLATVYGIAKQAGGYVTADSKLGQGSTLRVYFPAKDEPVTACTPRSTSPVRCIDDATILVCEDEPAVLATFRGVLEAQGFRVLAAEDGQRALELAARHPGKIDLLLTDVIMPVMNGLELAGALSELQPDVNVIFMSGYPADALGSVGVLSNQKALLAKPFDAQVLLEAVQKALCSPEDS